MQLKNIENYLKADGADYFVHAGENYALERLNMGKCMNKVNRLNIRVPRTLVQALGYKGKARWIQLYWEPEPVEKPICTDGQNLYVGSRVAWELIIEDITTKCGVWNFPHKDACLLLDRREQIIYCSDKETVKELVNQPKSLQLLNSLKGKQNLTQQRESVSQLVTGLIIGVTVAGTITGVALGLSGFAKWLDPWGVAALPSQTQQLQDLKERQIEEDRLNLALAAMKPYPQPTNLFADDDSQPFKFLMLFFLLSTSGVAFLKWMIWLSSSKRLNKNIEQPES